MDKLSLGRCLKLKTEVVEVGDEYGSEYKGKYVFQEITWAKRSRIIDKYTRYHAVTGNIVAMDRIAIQAETIWASLREQPPHKPISLEKLLSENPEQGIPTGLGELFSKVANRLNSVSRDEVAFLEGQSDTASHMKPLQSSAFARSSAGPSRSSDGSQQKRSSSSS